MTRYKGKAAARRKARTEKTLERYRYREFDWATGATCIHLVRTQLRNMGHKVPAVPRFYSRDGAKRAMAKAGFKSMEDLLDRYLPRIAPAERWLGDIVLLAAENEQDFDAYAIAGGVGGKVFSWHPDVPALGNLVPLHIKAAWRV